MKSILSNQLFAKSTRDLRYELGLTQSNFADRLGVKQGTISKIEAGHVIPGARLLIDMRRVFGIDVNAIFDTVNRQL